MPFHFSESHQQEYRTHGFTVFRAIVPPALIDDLRRAAERGRDLARAAQGPQTQRFQPVARFDIDLAPFEAFRDLPELRDAITRVLTPRHTYGDVNLEGVLLEPAELPYCTPWHRDWRDNMPYRDLAEWQRVFADTDYFNQSNCALYADASLWVVPGSHLDDNTEGEAATFGELPMPRPEFEGGSAERERQGLEYCRRMPGALRVSLDAGDFALYRSTLWHLGNYVPYARRATLHDFIDTPEFHAWRDTARQQAERRKAEGHAPWERSPVPAGINPARQAIMPGVPSPEGGS
jgi:hypothetical protein